MNAKSMKWTDEIDGSGTDWGNLPMPMELEFAQGETRGTNLLVFVHFSRVQHTTTNKNTEFRVLVNGAAIAIGNTGHADGWAYRDISLHGYGKVRPGEHLHVEVQYRTQGGTVQWVDSTHGPQERILTALVL